MISVVWAFLAALLYAVSIPVSKVLLEDVGPVFMSAFLYLGAGIGIGAMYWFLSRRGAGATGKPLTRKELPYTVGMIALDIAAPVFLMFGLTSSQGSSASLLSNFEIVATSLVALVFFRERISSRVWVAVVFITAASMLLSLDGLPGSGAGSGFEFSKGSLFVLAACVCWGFENNCTRMMASKNTFEIVILKGLFSGLGALVIAFISGESFPKFVYVLCTMLLGFFSYGLSIFFYVRAQNELGASKTSAFYAVAPFAGTFLSWLILREELSKFFLPALLLMAVGAVLVVRDSLVKG